MISRDRINIRENLNLLPHPRQKTSLPPPSLPPLHLQYMCAGSRDLLGSRLVPNTRQTWGCGAHSPGSAQPFVLGASCNLDLCSGIASSAGNDSGTAFVAEAPRALAAGTDYAVARMMFGVGVHPRGRNRIRAEAELTFIMPPTSRIVWGLWWSSG